MEFRELDAEDADRLAIDEGGMMHDETMEKSRAAMYALDDVADWLGFEGRQEYFDALVSERKEIFKRAKGEASET